MKFILAYQRILFRLGMFSNIYRCISKDGTFSYYALTVTEKEFRNSFMTESWFKKDEECYIMVERVFKSSMVDGQIYKLELEGDAPITRHIFSVK